MSDECFNNVPRSGKASEPPMQPYFSVGILLNLRWQCCYAVFSTLPVHLILSDVSLRSVYSFRPSRRKLSIFTVAALTAKLEVDVSDFYNANQLLEELKRLSVGHSAYSSPVSVEQRRALISRGY
jgi:hypothetical protein